MNIRQSFKVALRNMLADKRRLVQALLGLVVGVAAVVVILSVQRGMVNRIDATYKEYSPSLMMMMTYRPVDSALDFTEEDMERLAAEHPEYITMVSPLVYLYDAPIKYGDRTYEEFGAMGVGDRLLEISPVLRMAEGRFLQPMDISREQKVCVVTRVVAEEALGGDAVGKNLRIMGENFQVIGVIEEVEDDQGQFNGVVYVPYTVAKKMQPDRIVTMAPNSGYSGDYIVSQYYVNANGMENIANARITVQDALLALYGEKAIHYSASYRYYREGELTPIYDAAQKLLLAAVGVLIVGGVGVMNVMLAVVAERTGEIGIRKAFGASRGDIRRQFVIETVCTGLVGGFIGVVLGVLGSVVACGVLELPLRWISAAGLAAPVAASLAAAVLVGVVFGLYPAAKAAKMEIVDAIRGKA